MGFGQGRAGTLIAVAALLMGGAAPRSVPLREARWLETKDLAGDLAVEPGECRLAYSDPALEREAAIGRIAFRAPLLLGGQAARVGLSCSSCHRNGRTNPDFHFPGLSGKPGTADVTSSLMSSHRGDGVFNPKPIPDLAGDPAKLKVSRDPKREDLRKFIHGLITQEFDGPEPSPAVLDGLAAYVRSLSPAACTGQRGRVIRLSPLLDNVEAAVRLAEQSAERGDLPTAHFLISAARSTLGSINERFEVAGGATSQALLRDADADLQALELPARMSPADLAKWERKWPDRVRQLRAAEGLSLFSEAVLRRELEN